MFSTLCEIFIATWIIDDPNQGTLLKGDRSIIVSTGSLKGEVSVVHLRGALEIKCFHNFIGNLQPWEFMQNNCFQFQM